MGKKYIIELEDKPFHKEDGDFLYRVKGFNSLVFDMTGVGKLTPYTEPDLGRVRKEAYKIGYEKGYRDGVNRIGDAEDKIRKEAFEEGKKQAKVQAELNVCHDIEKVAKENYKAGLSDAWEAAKKLWDLKGEMIKAFRKYSVFDILNCYTAAEAIEKIRQYEQEHEEIKAGDEVENTQTGVKFIVTHLWKNNRGEQGVSGFNQECSAFSTTLSLVVKTGRTFPEIAAILKKMREGQDG